MRTRLLCLAFLTGLGTIVLLALIRPALAQDPLATSRVADIGGLTTGEVVVDGKVLFRIRTTAGGVSSGDRAAQVADRLNDALQAGVRPQDVSVVYQGGLPVVMAGTRQIITATAPEARANVSTPAALAAGWANNLRVALGGQPVAATPAATPTAQVAGSREAVDWTSQADKVVPIVSAGTPGVSIGAARVSGPEAQVRQVKAVAQLDATFRSVARIRIFVPVSSISTRLDRVQGVSVNALIDMRIVEF